MEDVIATDSTIVDIGDFIDDGYTFLPADPSQKFDRFDAISSSMRRLYQLSDLLDPQDYLIRNCADSPYFELSSHNGFTRMVMHISLISILSQNPEHVRKLVHTGDLGITHGRIGDDDNQMMTLLGIDERQGAFQFLRQYAQILDKFIHECGFTDSNLRLALSNNDSHLFCGFTHYEPKARVNGGRERLHRDSIPNGISGSVQFSNEITKWLLGADSKNLNKKEQHHGDKLLMNCLATGTGSTRIIHEPQIGYAPRTSGIFTATGDLAYSFLDQMGVLSHGSGLTIR